MNIRTRLTLLFIIIVAIIIIFASVAIYFFSADYRQDDFYNRLLNKGNNTAKLLIEVEEVDAGLLRRIEKNNPVSLPNEKIVIYDYRNDIIFSTDEDNVIQIDRDLLDQVRLDGEVRFRQGKYEVLGFLFADKYDRFVVIAAATDIYGLNKLRNLGTILLIVFGISIVLVSFSGWFFAGRALRPISKVVHQVDEISISRLDLRVDEGNGKDEIAQLARTFNDMLTRLETSFIIQKNFIANASHELRTPLTAVTGQLEVTLLNTRTTEEYKQTLNSVLEDIKNLNNLCNRLLLLAQASSDTSDRKLKKIRVDELLWQTKDELSKLNPGYSITIDLDPQLDDESRLTIAGDEQLIKAALANVIENGCKYSPDHAVTIYVTSFSGNISLHFTDKGIGIPDEDLPNIFEPFHRGHNTQNTKGHGIGLSMVERIIKLHHGSIHVNSKTGQGTTFTLAFPLNRTF